MTQLAWLLLPDHALPLVFVTGAILLILGFRRTAASLMGTALAIPMIAPFVESAAAILPSWLALVLLAGLAFWVVRTLAALVLGRRAADHFVAILAADVVRAVVVSLLLLPARTVRAVFAALTSLQTLAGRGLR